MAQDAHELCLDATFFSASIWYITKQLLLVNNVTVEQGRCATFVHGRIILRLLCGVRTVYAGTEMLKVSLNHGQIEQRFMRGCQIPIQYL